VEFGGLTMTRTRLGQAYEIPSIDELDGDCTPGDMIDILRRLQFGAGFSTVQLDRDARDFLVAAIAARCGKHG
jgi:hypothetical protein